MKYIFISLIASVTFLSKAVSQSIPTTEEFFLDNGLKVIMIPYGQLKTMSAALYVNCGVKNETPGRELFSEIAAQCITMGSTSYDKKTLKDNLFKMGTTLDVDVNENFTSVESAFTEKDYDAGLALMAASVISPAFNEAEIKQYISQILDYNNPMKLDILQQVQLYSKLWVYGTQNPIGRF